MLLAYSIPRIVSELCVVLEYITMTASIRDHKRQQRVFSWFTRYMADISHNRQCDYCQKYFGISL